MTKIRAQLVDWIETPTFRYTIIGVIIFNALILGLETSKPLMERAGWLIYALDRICLAIFIAELCIKLFALGPRFFRDGWNIFDFVIVGIALVPNSGGLAVLRALLMAQHGSCTAAPCSRRALVHAAQR